jgi:hypothetical protein
MNMERMTLSLQMSDADDISYMSNNTNTKGRSRTYADVTSPWKGKDTGSTAGASAMGKTTNTSVSALTSDQSVASMALSLSTNTDFLEAIKAAVGGKLESDKLEREEEKQRRAEEAEQRANDKKIENRQRESDKQAREAEHKERALEKRAAQKQREEDRKARDVEQRASALEREESRKSREQEQTARGVAKKEESLRLQALDAQQQASHATGLAINKMLQNWELQSLEAKNNREISEKRNEERENDLLGALKQAMAKMAEMEQRTSLRAELETLDEQNAEIDKQIENDEIYGADTDDHMGETNKAKLEGQPEEHQISAKKPRGTPQATLTSLMQATKLAGRSTTTTNIFANGSTEGGASGN